MCYNIDDHAADAAESETSQRLRRIEMGKYTEKIKDSSIWITATPAAVVQTLPFFVTEAGHFIAEPDYIVKRDMHESYLLLYTLRGKGMVSSNGAEFELKADSAAVINCRVPHMYSSADSEWEFIWIHFNGACAAAVLDAAFTGAPAPAEIQNASDFTARAKALISALSGNDIITSLNISSMMHTLINITAESALMSARGGIRREYSSEIDSAAEYIRRCYAEQISIDDIMSGIHISKYHFIRLFSRKMGSTPYSYLTNYRINESKTMLRTTDKTVAEIAELCGFTDTSNFISQFKRHTGQTPLQYRRDFT